MKSKSGNIVGFFLPENTSLLLPSEKSEGRTRKQVNSDITKQSRKFRKLTVPCCKSNLAFVTVGYFEVEEEIWKLHFCRKCPICLVLWDAFVSAFLLKSLPEPFYRHDGSLDREPLYFSALIFPAVGHRYTEVEFSCSPYDQC